MHTVRREASTVNDSIELPALLWKATEVSVYVHGAAFHMDARECGVLVYSDTGGMESLQSESIIDYITSFSFLRLTPYVFVIYTTCKDSESPKPIT